MPGMHRYDKAKHVDYVIPVLKEDILDVITEKSKIMDVLERGVEEIIENNLRIVNRNPGSGTRMLLDYYLKQMAMNLNDRFENLIRKINGYEIEAKSHTAVAVAVLTGKADVGLGIRSVAEMYGLDFIPLREEEYDFVIPKDKFEKQPVKDFIETLKSDEFKNEIKNSSQQESEGKEIVSPL